MSSAGTSLARRFGKGGVAGFNLWREAMRWQRAVDEVLRPLRLTHTQVLVLASSVRAIREDDEGATQAAIAKEAGLDRATTAAVLRALESRGFVNRDIDCDDGRSWSIAVTSSGERALAAAIPLVERASARALGD